MYVTDKPIKAKMFGNFELTCGDISLMGASKTGESQFAYLMQRLLHAGEAGSAGVNSRTISSASATSSTSTTPCATSSTTPTGA